MLCPTLNYLFVPGTDIRTGWGCLILHCQPLGGGIPSRSQIGEQRQIGEPSKHTRKEGVPRCLPSAIFFVPPPWLQSLPQQRSPSRYTRRRAPTAQASSRQRTLPRRVSSMACRL